MSENTRNILIVADSGFYRLCVNPEQYITQLKNLLSESSQGDCDLKTVTGKYGLKSSEIEALEIEDRNKTVFVQTIENLTFQCDELIVISIIPNDPYLDALIGSLTARHTCIRRYKYGVNPT